MWRSSWCNLFANPLRLLAGLAGLWLLSVLIYFYTGLLDPFLPSPQIQLQTCRPEQDAPDLFVIKTALNIDYNAGQWFHMTENTIVHFSRLLRENKESNASSVLFLFDEGKIVHMFILFLPSFSQTIFIFH